MITKHANLLKKLPSFLYKLGAQSWIDKTFPRHLFIETTASCNLSCSYCPREKEKSHMDWETFQDIIDEASWFGPRSFSLHLFGEPMLYPKWYEAIRYIKSSNKRNTVLFTTNGTMLEKGDNLARLIDSGIDKVLWSWRSEAKFSEETKRRLKKWGAFTVRLIEEVTPKEAVEEWRNWPNLERRKLHNYGGEIQLSKFGAKNTVGKRYPCYHLWFAPAVAWNGNLLICCADSHQKEVIGTFPEMSVAEGWKKIEDKRLEHINGKYEGICKTCDVWKSYPNPFFSSQYTG